MPDGVSLKWREMGESTARGRDALERHDFAKPRLHYKAIIWLARCRYKTAREESSRLAGQRCHRRCYRLVHRAAVSAEASDRRQPRNEMAAPCPSLHDIYRYELILPLSQFAQACVIELRMVEMTAILCKHRIYHIALSFENISLCY